MKILVVTDRYPPHIVGGYEIACHGVTERMRLRGHDVRVLTSTYGVRRPRVDGHVSRVLHRPQDTSTLLQLGRWELDDHRAIRQLAQSWKPDLVSCWSMLQLFPSLHLAVKEIRAPVVQNLHDVWLPTHLAIGDAQRAEWHGPGRHALASFRRRVLRTVFTWRDPCWSRHVDVGDVPLGHAIFCSAYQRARHQEAGLPLRDSRIIYNGIDPLLFHPSVSREDTGVFRVLFVGRLIREKGAHTAIEAMAELVRRGRRRFQLSIVGVPAYPFEYGDELHRLVDEGANAHVRFLGMVPNVELPDVYRAHDALVFPSTHLEGLPMTLLEAMACGVPVVATESGGSREILEDATNSLIVPPRNPVALADCLCRLSDTEELARSLVAAGSEFVRAKCHIDRNVDQAVDYFRDIVAGS